MFLILYQKLIGTWLPPAYWLTWFLRVYSKTALIIYWFWLQWINPFDMNSWVLLTVEVVANSTDHLFEPRIIIILQRSLFFLFVNFCRNFLNVQDDSI